MHILRALIVVAEGNDVAVLTCRQHSAVDAGKPALHRVEVGVLLLRGQRDPRSYQPNADANQRGDYQQVGEVFVSGHSGFPFLTLPAAVRLRVHQDGDYYH